MTFSNSKWTAVQGRILPLILALLLSLSILPGCSGESGVESSSPENSASIEQPAAEEEVAAPEAAGDGEATLDVSQVLGYTGSPYVVIADNVPGLTEADAEGVTESYSPLVARGVQMEALSLGDGGQGVSFNVYCYNVQQGVSIDYATGESWRSDQQGGSTFQLPRDGLRAEHQQQEVPPLGMLLRRPHGGEEQAGVYGNQGRSALPRLRPLWQLQSVAEPMPARGNGSDATVSGPSHIPKRQTGAGGSPLPGFWGT